MPHVVFSEIVEYLRDEFAALVASDIAVSVGAPPGADIPSKYLAVAYGGDDRAGITSAEVEVPGYNTGEFSAEDGEIWVTISTASGDQNALAQMKVTQAIFDLCEEAISADPKMGGILKNESKASVGTNEWVLEEGGQVATLFFVVRVQARWLQ